MIDPVDKNIYKITYAQTYLRQPSEAETLSAIAMAISFINKMKLLPVYQNYYNDMMKELKDEDMRIAMMEEQEENGND
jgi:hypothetical protein